MLRLMLISAVCTALALPAQTQDASGKSLMERGAELFLEGLRQEMEPTIEDLRGFADQFGPALQSFMREMGPALADLAAQVQDWSAYEAPEMLPNGDIIIRKKPKDQPEEVVPEEETSNGYTDI